MEVFATIIITNIIENVYRVAHGSMTAKDHIATRMEIAAFLLEMWFFSLCSL